MAPENKCNTPLIHPFLSHFKSTLLPVPCVAGISHFKYPFSSHQTKHDMMVPFAGQCFKCLVKAKWPHASQWRGWLIYISKTTRIRKQLLQWWQMILESLSWKGWNAPGQTQCRAIKTNAVCRTERAHADNITWAVSNTSSSLTLRNQASPAHTPRAFLTRWLSSCPAADRAHGRKIRLQETAVWCLLMTKATSWPSDSDTLYSTLVWFYRTHGERKIVHLALSKLLYF